jgi:hypothetical protein
MITGDQKHARYDAVALAAWSTRLAEAVRTVSKLEAGRLHPGQVLQRAWRTLLEQDHAEAVEMHAQRADSEAYAAELAARVELPKRVPGRAAKIAAVHMLAEYLADHPDLPVPDSLVCTGGLITPFIDQQNGVDRDEKARVAELLEWAAANGAELFEASSGIVATIVLAVPGVHGIDITYTRHVSFDESRPRRYLP